MPKATLRSTLFELRELLTLVLNNPKIIDCSSMRTSDSMQSAMQYLHGRVQKHHGSDSLNELLSIVVLHLTKAELAAPGTSIRVIAGITEGLLKILQGKPPPELSTSFVRPCELVARPVDAAYVDALVRDCALEAGNRAADMLVAALELAGPATMVTVESADVDSVELTDGYTFEHSRLWNDQVDLEHPRVICLDGYVESVSELNTLLSTAAEDRLPTVAFMRGLSDEVLNVIKLNNDRGTLRFTPVIVKFDLAGINALNDISIACGCELVSSNLGMLISAVSSSRCTVIDRLSLRGDRVHVWNDATRRNVMTHVKELKRRRLDQSAVDTERLLNDRIRSLSTGHVIIRVNDEPRSTIVRSALDKSLRKLSTSIRHGVIDRSSSIDEIIIARAIVDCLTSLHSVSHVVKS